MSSCKSTLTVVKCGLLLMYSICSQVWCIMSLVVEILIWLLILLPFCQLPPVGLFSSNLRHQQDILPRKQQLLLILMLQVLTAADLLIRFYTMSGWTCASQHVTAFSSMFSKPFPTANCSYHLLAQGGASLPLMMWPTVTNTGYACSRQREELKVGKGRYKHYDEEYYRRLYGSATTTKNTGAQSLMSGSNQRSNFSPSLLEGVDEKLHGNIQIKIQDLLRQCRKRASATEVFAL